MKRSMIIVPAVYIGPCRIIRGRPHHGRPPGFGFSLIDLTPHAPCSTIDHAIISLTVLLLYQVPKGNGIAESASFHRYTTFLGATVSPAITRTTIHGPEN
jgi:hypothetical protein